MTLILGVNSAYHESSAALLRDGRIVFAVEEERLSRVKHAKRAEVGNPDQLPWRAIDACLMSAGARARDLDAIGFSFMPGKRPSMVGADPYPLADPRGWGTGEGEGEFDARVRDVPRRLAERAGDSALAARVKFVPHHRAHAADAFFAGPFEEAALLVVDGIGEAATAWLGRGSGSGMTEIEEVAYPHSLGMLWEKLAQWLGFGEYDAGTVMGLAAHGDPARFQREAGRLLHVPDPEGGTAGRQPLPFQVDIALARFRGDLAGLESLFGPRRLPGEPLPGDPRFADAAAALQKGTEEAVLATARRLHRATGLPRLAYSGGVALNCVANARLEGEGPFAEVYIPGPAHDAGTAVGAALEAAPEAERTRAREDGRPPGALLGPEFGDDAVGAALQAAGLKAERVADSAARAAGMVAEGRIVGWFQGRLEFGPRALGNRSLLADPRRPETRLRLNERIKRREPFRPFAASCLAEELEGWFEVPAGRRGAAAARELMLFAYPVRRERASEIPAVVHHDGTCRIQTVHAERQPLYHSLVAHFARLTGVPLVLNTSFNEKEPIVCSPADAIRTFACTGIDALFLGDRLVLAAP
ncbi:MAG: carbamoyltransferase [Planctomycetes bacterium]|nr:carbamoyltransferase [Planctomycetota bacterium]